MDFHQELCFIKCWAIHVLQVFNIVNLRPFLGIYIVAEYETTTIYFQPTLQLKESQQCLFLATLRDPFKCPKSHQLFTVHRIASAYIFKFTCRYIYHGMRKKTKSTRMLVFMLCIRHLWCVFKWHISVAIGKSLWLFEVQWGFLAGNRTIWCVGLR